MYDHNFRILLIIVIKSLNAVSISSWPRWCKSTDSSILSPTVPFSVVTPLFDSFCVIASNWHKIASVRLPASSFYRSWSTPRCSHSPTPPAINKILELTTIDLQSLRLPLDFFSMMNWNLKPILTTYCQQVSYLINSSMLLTKL